MIVFNSENKEILDIVAQINTLKCMKDNLVIMEMYYYFFFDLYYENINKTGYTEIQKLFSAGSKSWREFTAQQWKRIYLELVRFESEYELFYKNKKIERMKMDISNDF